MKGLGVRNSPALLREVEREDEQRGELRGEGLGAGDANLRAGVGRDCPLSRTRNRSPDDVADGERLRTLANELLLGGDGVGRFAGLGDEEAEHGGIRNGVAIAVFGCVVDVDGQSCQALDDELAGQAGVPGGSAGGDGDAGAGAEFLGGDLHVGQEDVAGIERDAAEGGVADGAGLLVDLLEHEVLVAGFFGLDGIPGDALGLHGENFAVEVGEDDAGHGEGGDFAVLQEVNVARVVEDAGDVGGEEEFSLANAYNRRWPHAGGDEGVGRVGGEDADGEGSGEALDSAADSFVEGDALGGGGG